MNSYLVAGASGATGRHLVNQLLNKGHEVRVIVRPAARIPEEWNSNPRISIIKENISQISLSAMAGYVKDCTGIGCCLGHNLTFSGIYGKPRRLVKNAVDLFCNAVELNAPGFPVKLALMNTAGNSNRDINEPVSIGQKFIVSLIRTLLPPHADNEQAADFLRLQIGQNNPFIEWTTVRPDSLIDLEEVSEYQILPSPARSAIFDPGKISRINVGNFMARLLSEQELWQHWKGQMPVIYNKEANK